MNQEDKGMSNTINKSDIGETMVYDWVCPDCDHSNDLYEDEPTDGDTLTCEECYEKAIVSDDR